MTPTVSTQTTTAITSRLEAERTDRPFRLGVMGGTFDPIHHGHLVAASEVASVFDLDEVVFVPTGTPWQKSDREVAEAEHRYLMTVIATAANPRFTVSRVDIDRPGPTYTIDTLRDLRSAASGCRTVLHHRRRCHGEDLSWKDAEELWTLAHFVGVTRPGHELPVLDRNDVSLMEVPAMAISSTDCRERVQPRIRCGTWCRTASSSTSPSTSFTTIRTTQ